MKKLLIFSAVIAASLVATKSYSQVYIGARIGFRVPAPRVYVAPAPVVYDNYQPAPEPAYDGGYYAPPATCETEYPGYAYYDYPAWCGHYRDRVYFEHYRPWFYRDHSAYFYHGGFDHDRWEHDRGWHNGWREHEGWHEHEGRHEGWHRDRW